MFDRGLSGSLFGYSQSQAVKGKHCRQERKAGKGGREKEKLKIKKKG